jgi:hypothetical protein
MRHILFSSMLCLLVISSCKKEEIQDPVEPVDQTETYNSVKNIIENSCLGCHSTSQNAYIHDFTSYEFVKAYLETENNTMIERLNSDDEFYRMPPSGNLSDTDKQKLIDWINSGYNE